MCKCVVEEEVGPQLAPPTPGGRPTVKILAQLVQIHMLRGEYTLATSKKQEHNVSLMLNAIHRL